MPGDGHNNAAVAGRGQRHGHALPEVFRTANAQDRPCVDALRVQLSAVAMVVSSPAVASRPRAFGDLRR